MNSPIVDEGPLVIIVPYKVEGRIIPTKLGSLMLFPSISKKLSFTGYNIMYNVFTMDEFPKTPQMAGL